jgi:hypothetical protein
MLFTLATFAILALQGAPAGGLEEALAAQRDVWAEAAMRQPNGASYEFFESLLPPLRYVDAEFRHYPIVLSAPDRATKARYVSNGSGVNLVATTPWWQVPGLLPVAFLVGDPPEAFGADVARLRGPTLEGGWQPILRTEYALADGAVEQEAFASVEPPFDAGDASVFVRFRASGPRGATVRARVGSGETWLAEDGFVRDPTGRAWVWYAAPWRWAAPSAELVAELGSGATAALVVLTRGAGAPAAETLTDATYEAQRARCIDTWRGVIERAIVLETPEPRVDDAWKATLVGTLLLADGDTLNYSALNGYARTFQAECGDAVRALSLFGLAEGGRRVAALLGRPLQPGVEYSDVAFKLQMLAHAYWLTRDGEFVERHRALWWPETRWAIDAIAPGTGLLPPSAYCGDVATQVHGLVPNSSLWRGLRDMAAVLDQHGEREDAKTLRRAARPLRQAIQGALAKSETARSDPPFVPMALFGAEQPYERLTATRLGSYWNLIAPYVVDSGVFGSSGKPTQWILDTMHERGGLCMGLVRFDQHSGLFANADAVDDLYGLRYVLELLRRDDVERALASFYGKLAHGLTRDTYVGAEGTGLRPLDAHGRPMFQPPNCASNAFFLWMLRSLLVQDWDLDQDGEPETLRLCFATPRRWLADGARFRMERAPTAFGAVSVAVESRLSEGLVRADVSAPERRPQRALLRLRLPSGWRAIAARTGERDLALDSTGAIDITALTGRFSIELEVGR